MADGTAPDLARRGMASGMVRITPGTAPDVHETVRFSRVKVGVNPFPPGQPLSAQGAFGHGGGIRPIRSCLLRVPILSSPLSTRRQNETQKEKKEKQDDDYFRKHRGVSLNRFKQWTSRVPGRPQARYRGRKNSTIAPLSCPIPGRSWQRRAAPAVRVWKSHRPW